MAKVSPYSCHCAPFATLHRKRYTAPHHRNVAKYRNDYRHLGRLLGHIMAKAVFYSLHCSAAHLVNLDRYVAI